MKSSKNNLPIRRGVILIAGPNNIFYPGHWHFYVVDPEEGRCLDPNNNITILDRQEMESMWVGEWRLIPSQEWWQEMKNGITEDLLYMSGICAGCEDFRFGS